MNPSTTEKKSFMPNQKSANSYHQITSELLFPSKSFNRFSIPSDYFEIFTTVPAQEVCSKKNHLIYKFLAYRSTEELPGQLMNKVLDSAYRTKSLDSSSPDIEIFELKRAFYDKFDKRLNFIVSGPRKAVFHAAKSLTGSFPDDFDDFSYRISAAVEKREVPVSKLMNSFSEMAERFEDENRYVLKCIQIELQKRKKCQVPIKNGSLSFIEINSHMNSFRRVSVTVSVNSGVILLKYALNHDEFLKGESLSSRDMKNLKKYIISINKTLYQGSFSFQSTIIFQFSYHSSNVTKENMSTCLMIQKDLDLINIHIPQFQKILLHDFETLEEVIDLGKSAKLIPRFTHKYLKSSISAYTSLQALKNALNRKNDFFLSNRFNFKRIHFNSKEQVLTCVVPTQFLTFDEMIKENPDLVIQSIEDLIEELGSVSVSFKNSHFPLNRFVWNEEKPVFDYEVCLSEVLQIQQSEIPEAVSQTKLSVLKEISKFHLQSLESCFFHLHEAQLLFKNSQLVEVPLNTAHSLCRVLQSNASVVCKECFGVCKMTEKEFLICSKVTIQPLANFLKFLSFSQKLEVFRQLFGLVEIALQKNSEIVSLDPECLVLDQFLELKLDLKPQEMISKKFKAPEVIKGRSARSSLIYSFGKISEVLFRHRTENANELKVVDSVREVVRLCTQKLVPRRASVEGLKTLVNSVITSY